MKQYNTPEVELINFQATDVLAGSGSFNPHAEEGNGWNAGPDQSTGFNLF